MATIKAGWGVYVGQDFTRLQVDTPIEIRERHGSQVYGTIAGDKGHARGFMRSDRVSVRVDAKAVVD